MSDHASSNALAVPGLLFGSYPQRPAPDLQQPSAMAGWMRSLLRFPQRFGAARMQAFIAAVGQLETLYTGMTGGELRERALTLRAALSREALNEPLLVQAFALIRAVAVQQLGIRPFDTQLMAARVMLDNRLAEMATGEGKTLAAAICAATAALAGIPVHVVTVNDYLVARDAQTMQPLYAGLGLTVGHLVAAHDEAERRQAYQCDITYCTAKELVFDYLRDQIARGPRQTELQRQAARYGAAGSRLPQTLPHTLLRGLCMAIVDEADSVLIDEARVPLILSRNSANSGELQYHAKALELARGMRAGVDCTLDAPCRSANLTGAGTEKLEALCAGLAGVWHNRRHREETVCSALAALHLYRRDRDYLVHQGAVVIVDQATGRLAPGRVWSRGLHQLIELKEGCKPTGEQVTAAQITYQRFFARYLRLTGMSGTLREARAELAAVYRLDVVEVALRVPARRVMLPARLVRDREAQWRVVTERALQISRAGRPVLIGTDSVADSESLSEALNRAGLAHQVLNARHDLHEARIVASAGEAGRITVATNMAGRGTDIGLGIGVAGRGGLHVICCQHNASRRIDRQLIGRCARQGDPGSAQTLVALDKPLISRIFPAWLVRTLANNRLVLPACLVALVLRLPQVLEEGRQRAQRRLMQQQDAHAERALFSGIPGD